MVRRDLVVKINPVDLRVYVVYYGCHHSQQQIAAGIAYSISNRDPMDTREGGYKKYFEISVEDNWVRILAAEGIVVNADLLISTLKELHSMEAYRNEKPGSIWDFRGCASDLDFEKILEIKKYIESSFDERWTHRFAAFVVDQDLLFGLGRMYEMIAEEVPTTVRVFKDMGEAENWLNNIILENQVEKGAGE